VVLNRLMSRDGAMATDIRQWTTVTRKSRRPAELRPVDEHANLVTHGLGLVLSLVASGLLMVLVVETRSTIETVACAAYCFSLVGVYAASTLSHSFYDRAGRRVFRTLDQAFIFLLIAGSFTPFAAVNFGRGWAWPVLLGTMWALAMAGVGLVIRMRNLTPGARNIYLILGWLPVLFSKAIFTTAPTEFIFWIFAGGGFYSVGTLFLKFDRHVRYFHALWHTFVIAGSICHYNATLLLVMT
jgi:hemolysin III